MKTINNTQKYKNSHNILAQVPPQNLFHPFAWQKMKPAERRRMKLAP